jgi:hypothetical protein
MGASSREDDGKVRDRLKIVGNKTIEDRRNQALGKSGFWPTMAVRIDLPELLGMRLSARDPIDLPSA